MRFSTSALLLLAVAIAAVAGCERADPHASLVEATSGSGLGRWRIQAGERFTREEWREFDAALQELRLRVMAERQASGSEAVQEAMCSRINGLTFREVLVLGHEATLLRLRPVRDELKRAVDTNALLVTKPGDRASASYLENLSARQTERLEKIDAEIALARRRLVELGAAKPEDASGADEIKKSSDAAPPALTRAAAMEHVAQMIHEQREAGRLKFGAWPVKLDRVGSSLPDRERADFTKRRAAAAANGRVAIAVRLRNRWWIYEGAAESPSFSGSVTANLTGVDRRAIDEMWWSLQAELWARREAQEPL
jgi:hypothetical protein